MEALSLLTLWQIDEEEDSFFDIDFTIPINRNTENKNSPKTISSLLAHANSYRNSSKHSSNNVLGKYMKLIKPLYSKASKRKFPEEFVSGGEKKSPLREVYSWQLRKSRSTSSAVGVVERRDDSLIQHHDGIQSAILHCRTSYYSSREEKTVDEVQRRISI